MQRIRVGGPPSATRPFVPGIGTTDVEVQKAEALDHIARALAAIDHNIEVLATHAKTQNELLGRILMAIPQSR